MSVQNRPFQPEDPEIKSDSSSHADLSKTNKLTKALGGLFKKVSDKAQANTHKAQKIESYQPREKVFYSEEFIQSEEARYKDISYLLTKANSEIKKLETEKQKTGSDLREIGRNLKMLKKLEKQYKSESALLATKNHLELPAFRDQLRSDLISKISTLEAELKETELKPQNSITLYSISHFIPRELQSLNEKLKWLNSL